MPWSWTGRKHRRTGAPPRKSVSPTLSAGLRTGTGTGTTPGGCLLSESIEPGRDSLGLDEADGSAEPSCQHAGTLPLWKAALPSTYAPYVHPVTNSSCPVAV